MDITKEMLETWLGGDNTKEESINILLQIANYEYEIEILRDDIINH